MTLRVASWKRWCLNQALRQVRYEDAKRDFGEGLRLGPCEISALPKIVPADGWGHIHL